MSVGEVPEGAGMNVETLRDDGRRFARLRLRLTATGEHTLAGEADRVELLGIDRWIGGTHVTPGTTWRWDPTERRLVRPSPG